MKLNKGSILAVGFSVVATILGACDSGTKPQDEKDLALTYPKGGEIFKVGDSVVVTWKAKAGSAISSVYFKVSTDNGVTWTESIINGSVPTGAGRWTWKVGSEYWSVNPAYPSDRCLLKILSYDPLNQYRDSSSVFSVLQ